MTTASILLVLALVAIALLAERNLRLTRLAKSLRERAAQDRVAMDSAREQIEDILDHLPVGVAATVAATGQTVFANRMAQNVLMGRTPAKIAFTDDEGVPLDPSANPFVGITAPSPAMPACVTKADGTRQHLTINSIVMDDDDGNREIVYIMQDETARVFTEQALERSHRLEALGSLTRGIAHDFNNMLTPIIGSIDMLKRDNGLSDASIRAVDRATQAAGLAATLVQRLLAFAREQQLEPQQIGLKALAEATCDLFGRKLGPDITAFVTAAADPVVEVDPNQFEIAMLNLMVNARDAMPDGGTLRMTIDEEDVPEGHPDLPAGRYAVLSTTDEGVGMTDEVRQRAVEPFFTTKEAGKASGLGLSMVDGLAAQSGGGIRIESTPGHGTRVDVLLPVATPHPAGAADAPDEPAAIRRTRILLVDDDDLVRGATADMLTDIGHDVVQAISGAEGLAILRKDPTIEAVVADHLMPGMTGGAMIHEIWDATPGFPALLISGYARTGALPSDMPHLAKPFRRADLARAVNDMRHDVDPQTMADRS